MIIGAHALIYSKSPDSDRAFFRDVLELTSVDVGGGWLISGLPPAEVAVHPSEKNDVHEPRHARPKAMSAAEARSARG